MSHILSWERYLHVSIFRGPSCHHCFDGLESSRLFRSRRKNRSSNVSKTIIEFLLSVYMINKLHEILAVVCRKGGLQKKYRDDCSLIYLICIVVITICRLKQGRGGAYFFWKNRFLPSSKEHLCVQFLVPLIVPNLGLNGAFPVQNQHFWTFLGIC